MLLATVLLPDPVEPMIPNDSPAFILNDILSIPTTPVSGYLNDTFLNSIFPEIFNFLCFLDNISVFSTRNSLILF